MAALPDKHSVQSKKAQVEEMFDKISPKYDLLNHLLSFHIDKIWRKRAIESLRSRNPEKILDVATGTGDFALAAMRLKNAMVTGVDISEGMLEIGQSKIEKKGLSGRIQMQKADSENLPFGDHLFDAVTVGFGVRNFENLGKGLAEIFRVLRPGGVLAVLEFSKPRKAPFRQLYYFYFSHVLPLLGRFISKHSSAYSYLPESVKEFPDGNDFTVILENTGFVNPEFFPLTFGIATLYLAIKPQN